MSQVLCFNEFTFSPVTRDSQTWIKSSELAKALGYKDESSVRRIYERNANEFTENMTQVVEIVDTVNLTVTGNLVSKVRIFSLRGCHLIAMFARTPVAKAFRHWVLDVIEQYGDRVQVKTTPSTPKLAPSTTATRKPLEKLIKVWVMQSGMAHPQCWTMLNAHFGLERIGELPEAWIPDAIAWVQERIEACGQRALPERCRPCPQRLILTALSASIVLSRSIPHSLAQHHTGLTNSPQNTEASHKEHTLS